MGLSTAVDSELDVVEASSLSGMLTNCEFDVESFQTWSDNGAGDAMCEGNGHLKVKSTSQGQTVGCGFSGDRKGESLSAGISLLASNLC